MTLPRTSLAAIALVGALGVPASLGAQPIERPDWSAHFRAGGIALRTGVLDAVVLEDKISDGVGVDMSVIVDAAGLLLDNGVVPGPDDLGNGYLLARADGLGHLVYHVGVERLVSTADTWVEFELNRGIVRVRSGAPWPIDGERQPGDLVVRLDYEAGVLTRAALFVWDGRGLRAAAGAAAGGAGCTDVGSILLICDGPPPLQSAQADVWDVHWRPLAPPPADGFVEIGVDVTALLGSNVPFTTVQIRTPRDIILDSFRMTGSGRRHLAGGGSHD